MISFKNYLEEAVAQMKRESMIHFRDMPDDVFDLFLSELKKQKGILKPDTKIYAKLDGFPVKFGLDESGKFFLETSSSGPKYEPDFLKFTENKLKAQEELKGVNKRRDEMLHRGASYDEVFDILSNLKVLKSFGTNFKIYAEVMFNKLGKTAEDGKSVKFVSVAYDKSKLGSDITIFPYRVLEADTNSVHPDSDTIIKKFISTSNSKTKIYPAKLEIVDSVGINLNSVLKSTTDKKELKNNIAAYLLAARDKIPDMYQLGDNIEGIVIWVGNKEYKITTKDFQEHKKAEKKK